MNSVRPKKHLGQHFLNDENIARKIVNSLSEKTKAVIEVGPGTGVLSKYLFSKTAFDTILIDIDRESIEYLEKIFPEKKDKIIHADFLKYDLLTLFQSNFTIIGNFPYNISSQILFKAYDYRDQVDEVIGMFQKEVAERIATPPGTKKYGILSVFLQAFYNIEYLFTVDENVFTPPPKVKSSVIRLRRNDIQTLDCDERFFFRVVKTAFNQRRKTLRNALKCIIKDPDITTASIFQKRAEQLGVEEFVGLTNLLA